MSMAIVMLLSESTQAMTIRKLGERLPWDLAQEDIQLEQAALARLDQKKLDGNLLQIESDPNFNTDEGYKLLHYKGEDKMPYDINYPVPNFGVDHDIKNTETDIELAEKQLKHKWNPKMKADKEDPKDYPVPNLGVDEDILGVAQSLRASQAQLGHTWDWKLKPAKAFKMGLDVPPYHRGVQQLDNNIKITLKNAAAAEKTLKHNWDPLKDLE